MSIGKPLVSVAMITYGHEAYIKEAIEGILMQECDFEVELIVANDCSPDNTDVVVKEILDNHPRAQWIKYTKHEKNKGMMPNFIWALERCQGKYIALCEGDDYWTDPLKLQKQVDFLEENGGYVISGHDSFVIDSSGSKIKDSQLLEHYKRDASSFEIKRSFQVLTQTMVFRNLPFLKKMPDEFLNVVNADMFLLSLLGEYGAYKYMGDILPSAYRIHAGGVWGLKSKIEQKLNGLESTKKRIIYYKRIQDFELVKYWRNHEENTASYILRLMILNKHSLSSVIKWYFKLYKDYGVHIFIRLNKNLIAGYYYRLFK